MVLQQWGLVRQRPLDHSEIAMLKRCSAPLPHGLPFAVTFRQHLIGPHGDL
jgi:hypothetical protein